jgi:hypothetical protein
VQVIPRLSKTSEEYAITKIALKINKGNMSKEYYKLQRREEAVFPGTSH